MRWWAQVPSVDRPRELIVVDDGSAPRLQVDGEGIRLHRHARSRGPAAARNVGWRAATGDWIAFVDSDCVPGAGWLHGFATCWDGEIALQGRVRALGSDQLSRFYDAQGVLRPMLWQEGRPSYLITANALVFRAALDAVGGFAEAFPFAAGEDVDLGLRLRKVGPLGWSSGAVVSHDFAPSILDFVSRFHRYGRGNRLLARRVHTADAEFFRPRPFLPTARGGTMLALAGLAYASLATGWLRETWSSR